MIDPQSQDIEPPLSDDPYSEEEEQAPEEPLTMEAILKNATNVADILTDEELSSISSAVTNEYQIDVNSRVDWIRRSVDAIDLAKQTVKKKSYPWRNAANVKFPLVTTAAIQFEARAYPAIVAGRNIVKIRVNGFDPDGKKRQRGARVAMHMSWQLLNEMKEWEEETDKMLIIIPIVGMCFRKTYFDRVKGRNVSKIVLAQNLVYNYGATSFDDCSRKTEELDLYPHQITERIRSGVFIDFEFGQAQVHSSESTNDRKTNTYQNDPDAPHRFLEQHRMYDLDNDGYPEPYICTVHKDTGKTVRVVPRFNEQQIEMNQEQEIVRITPDEYYTKYGFLPNPDGSAHDIGFGDILMPINETINDSVNMMLNAGHLQTVGGGFIGSGLRMKGGPIRRKLGEYVPVPTTGRAIRDNLIDIQHPGPSPVLFQLLGLMIDAGKDIASIKDILTGEQAVSNTPASTTLALIEQGLKVFTAIYKRIHRSFGQELQLLYNLNTKYMQPQQYFTLLDSQDPVEILKQDYQSQDMDITPISDPTMVTDMQRMARAEALVPMAEDPDFNGREIKRRYLEAMGIEDIEGLWATEEQQQGASEQQQQQLQMAMDDLENKKKEADAKVLNAESTSILNIAKAEAEELGQQLEQYRAFMETLKQVDEAMNGQQATQPGGSGSPQGNPGVPQVPALPGAMA
jgi:chaperonin GroES